MPLFKQISILKKLRFNLLVLSIIISVLQVRSQQVTFKQVTFPEISKFGLINGITQDRQGYMWLAVWNVGVRRYDGYQTITYSNDPKNAYSLVTNDVQTVLPTTMVSFG